MFLVLFILFYFVCVVVCEGALASLFLLLSLISCCCYSTFPLFFILRSTFFNAFPCYLPVRCTSTDFAFFSGPCAVLRCLFLLGFM